MARCHKNKIPGKSSSDFDVHEAPWEKEEKAGSEVPSEILQRAQESAFLMNTPGVLIVQMLVVHLSNTILEGPNVYRHCGQIYTNPAEKESPERDKMQKFP